MTITQTFPRYAIQVLLILMLAAFILTGCEDNPSEADDFEPQASLFFFAQPGAPLDTLRLEWTEAYNKNYDRSNLGIENADVILYPILDGDSSAVDSAGQVLRFIDAPGRDGYGDYIPADPNYRVNPTWSYRLEASKPADGVNVWAETCIPDTFSFYAAFKSDPLTPVNIDSMSLTREDDEVFINWSESAGARGFVLGIVAQTPRDELIPLDPEWDPDDPDDQFEDYELQRHNWTFARYDQRSMTIAWIFFEWSGWNELYINAASESYYMYMFSVIMQQDPSFTQNPEWNVHGGIGVFGGYSQHKFNIFLERAEP